MGRWVWFFCIRLSSCFIVQTWFVPDEYWQSLEVAHQLSFGYGYLTWEWIEGIRSWMYPVFISLLYKCLELLHLDSRLCLIHAPRIVQGMCTAYAEALFCEAVNRKFKRNVAMLFMILQLSSWFMFFTGSRTIANTVEMVFVLFGLTFYLNKQLGRFLANVMISCYLRPTCSALWFPFLVQFLRFNSKWMVSSKGLFTTLKCCLAFVPIFIMDAWLYRRWILVPFRFLQFNLLNNFSGFYGENPWHWYISNGVPVVLGPAILITLLHSKNYGKIRDKSHFRLFILSIVFYIFFHSLVPHKEFRFLVPIIPIFHCIAACLLNEASSKKKRVVCLSVLLWNLPLLLYFSVRHQRGTLDVMDYIAPKLSIDDSVLFLMPCHSTPLYSHVHLNATLRFLTCPPNVHRVADYIDEADLFYSNPSLWMENELKQLPNYIIMFDTLIARLSKFLAVHDYQMKTALFNTDFSDGRVGKYVIVFAR